MKLLEKEELLVLYFNSSIVQKKYRLTYASNSCFSVNKIKSWGSIYMIYERCDNQRNVDDPVSNASFQ